MDNKQRYNPQGNLTDEQWQELLGIEYTVTHYPQHYSDLDKAINRLNELRDLK